MTNLSLERGVELIGSGLLDSVIKGSALLGIALLATLLMRRAAAATRHLLLAISLTGVLAMPLLSLVLPGWHVLPALPLRPVLSREVPAPPAINKLIVASPQKSTAENTTAQTAQLRDWPSRPIASEVPPGTSPQIRLASTEPVTLSQRRRLDWHAWVALGWALGVALMLLPLIVSRLSLFWFACRLWPFTEDGWPALLRESAGQLGLSRRVLLLAGPNDVMPMTWGVLWPRIVLPDSARQWLKSRRRLVLLHELAHAKRCDCLWLLLGKLARAAHWYNPLAWWAVRRLQAEAERACDDRVLRCGEAPSDYAEQLLQIVKSLRPTRFDVLALGMARPSTFEARVRSILDATHNHRALTRVGVAVVAVVFTAVLLPTSMLKLGAQSAVQPAKAARPQTQPSGAPRQISVRIVSTDGSPRHSVLLRSTWRAYDPRGIQTDANGRAVLLITDQGPTEWIAISHEADAVGFFTVPPENLTAPLIVKLDLATTQVVGRVTDGGGHGVVGAQVECRAVLSDGRSYVLAAILTDDSGYYEHDDVPAGETVSLQVRLVPGGQPPGPWSDAVKPGVRPSVEMADLIDAHPPHVSNKPAWIAYGGTVQGEDGKPIVGADVYIRGPITGRPSFGFGRRAMTDANGRWRALAPPEVETVHVEVSHPQFVHLSVTPVLEQLRASAAVLVLKRGVELVGTVHDEQGKPVADALVMTSQTGFHMTGDGEPVQDSTMGRTGADGRFSVQGMVAGPRDLVAYAKGYPPALASTDIQPGMKPAEITLVHGGKVSGTIVDPEGKPIAGVRIGVMFWQYRGERPLPRRTTTDAAGQFVLTEMPTQGTVQLTYSAKGFVLEEVDDVVARIEAYQLTLVHPTKIRGNVVDDATGQPVREFQVINGTNWQGREQTAFAAGQRQTIRSESGSFERTFGGTVYVQPLPWFAVRVMARGYLPEDTPSVKGGDSAEFAIRLKPAKPITGTLLEPDGTPTTTASVAWVGAGRHAFVGTNGRLMDQFVYAPEVVVKSDPKGQFELPASRTIGTIFAVDDKGYAELSSADFKTGSSIRLTGWAKLEGNYKQGGTPAANAIVSVQLLDPQRRSREAPVIWMLTVNTNADGSFRFDHVPATPLAVGLPTTNGLASRVLLDPKPGQAETVQIGGGGEEVSGTIQLPPELGFQRVYSEFQPDKPLMLIDLRPAADANDDATLRPEQQDPGRELYAGIAEGDSGFVIHDVPDGQYVLHLAVRAAPQPGTCGLPVALAEASIPLAVAGRTVALGSIPVKMIPFATAGKPAPELQGLSIDGKPFSLASLHGKPVVLDFWASWCPSCKAQQPHVQKLWEQYGRDGKVGFVGIGLDDRPEIVRDVAQQAKMVWPVVCTEGGWGAGNAVLRRFGVTNIPSYWLISADGVVIARDIPPAQLDSTIAHISAAKDQ